LVYLLNHFSVLSLGVSADIFSSVAAPGCHTSLTTSCAFVNILQVRLADNPSKT